MTDPSAARHLLGSDEDDSGAVVAGSLASGSSAVVLTGGCSLTAADVSSAGDGALPAGGCAAVSMSATVAGGVRDVGGTLPF